MYPIVLTNLQHIRCVVIGGGAVAERKVLGLLAGGACPFVVSPTLTARLQELYKQGQVSYRAGHYCKDDLQGAGLVFAATNDPSINEAIAQEARRQGILVSRADDGQESDFHSMATVRRGELLLAVATGGGNPAFAAYLRERLSEAFGEEFAQIAQQAKALRSTNLSKGERRALFDALCGDV
jgi:precorrin-2 dehydrogenase / sirohydrochlorin ferrochelatase